MGPCRRKGSGRAAAAAQQQWKVGDLVLAKMRGFPAWPAMISEPEKWGFPAQRKKLFVYFYGTKQIAFCNYADIEAFTEEKKKSLLLKRQGKGADFVRAVDEIIDIYETLKKQKADESNSGDDDVVTTAEDLKCIGTSGTASSFRNCTETVRDGIEITDGVGPVEVLPTVVAVESENNLVIDKQMQIVSILDQLRQDPLANNNNSSRKKRLADASQHNSLKRVASFRKSRTSLSADSSKILDSTLVYDPEPSGVLTPDIIQNTNAESKIKHDIDVPCTVSSNGCSEEVGVEEAASGSDPNELCKGIVESTCHHQTSANEHLGNEVMINGNCKSPIESLAVHRKRKQNSKRVVISAESSLLNKDDLQEAFNSSPPNSLNKIKEEIHKTDGDEHLPLVKRARVRMGKPVVEKQHGEPVCVLEKMEITTVVNDCSEHHVLSSGRIDSPLNNRSSTVKEDVKTSSLNSCSQGNDHVFWKAKKYQLNGSMLDVEAALPPSKRLHRALEAMSANATQSTDDHPESPRVMDANASMNSLNRPSNAKVGSPLRFQSVYSSDYNIHTMSQSKIPMQDLQRPLLASSEVKPCDNHAESVKTPQDQCCNVTVEDGAKCNGFSVHEDIVTNIQKKLEQPCSSKFIEEDINVTSSDGVIDKKCTLLDETENDLKVDKDGSYYVCMDNINIDETAGSILHKEASCSNAEGVHSLPPDEVVPTVSALDMASVASTASGATICSSFQSDEDSHTGNMQGASGETQLRETPNCRLISPDLTPMKELIAAAQAKRPLSCSTSFSHNYLDSKAGSDAGASPSIVHKGNSSQPESPRSDSVNHTSTFGDKIHVHNGNISPPIGLRLKGISRSSHAEANAARKTFEALLCTLSRTKESIGRATRLAIDFGKYGMAGEVLELLLQYLEREQSLHKRVDLFFLVDSITQCSRNLKGGPGDAYPSLVQSMLPRLLSAAAPRGNAASENRRQCLKVLRLWLERKTLPESIVRHHMRELDCANELSFLTGSSRRPSRTERAINDPLREMEGMLVDEYGSNTNFQLPYLLRTNVLEDEEGNCSEEKSFEAVTPERCAQIDNEKGTTQNSTEKNRHVLEDVDVELEMEDVSPPSEGKMNSTCPSAGFDPVHSHQQIDQQCPLPFAPPLPEDRPPSPPPLPSSPPPLVSSSLPAHAVAPQWKSGAHALADVADLHPSISAPIMQNQQAHFFNQPANQNAGLMPSKPPTYYSSSYVCVPGQMPPPAPVSYGSTSASHPSTHPQNNMQPLVSTPLTDASYQLQPPPPPPPPPPLPPPPTVSNQFSYVQTEPQQRAQPWGNNNCSFPERYQYAQDSHMNNFHCDQASRRHFQNEVAPRSSFPQVNQPGPPLYDKMEASPGLPHYCRPPDPPPAPCNGWSLPPRMSNYSAPSSRPSVEGPIPNAAGAGSYWRPR